LVVLTFDDSVKSHLTNIAPLLQKHGFGGTFFVTRAWMDDPENFLSWEEIAQLDAMGFEIGNHSWSHVALHKPEALDVLDEEIGKVEQKLEAVGVRKPVSFSWPGNHFGPESRRRLKELGYRFARRGPMPNAPPTSIVGMGPLYDPQQHDPLLIPSSGLAVPQWQLHEMIEIVRRAGNGKIAVFQFHGIPDRAHPFCSLPLGRFEEFVEYLARENYTVVSLRDIDKHVQVDRAPQDPLASKRFFR
jgi:peptidoglycan/xylan/chitin deacetylase (PgdA/CDA1 family)